MNTKIIEKGLEDFTGDACATCPDNTPCANETIKIYKEEDKMI